MTDKKQSIDWPSIRSDWINSNNSIRKLAAWYQVSEAAIRKKANQEGWGERAHPKSAHPQETAHSPLSPVIMAGIDATDPEQIVGRGHNLTFRLLDELNATTTHEGQLASMIETHIDDEKARATIQRAVSLGARANVLKALATAFKTWNESGTAAPDGKKAKQQEAADEVAKSDEIFATRSGPRLAVSNK